MDKIIKKLSDLDPKIRKKILGFRDFEGAYIISRLIREKKKILNVGCLWGRDYYFLNCLNKDVVNLDLGTQKVPNLIIGDITKKTPFKNSEFDVVIMGDIIEHIFEDLAALEEVRRILKEDGLLIITVPYYDDAPDYHVRMHSKRTMIRLLRHSGFEVDEIITRGGLISLSKIFAIPSIVFSKISIRWRIKYLSMISEWDYYLGKKDFKILKFSKSYGGYFLSRKGNKKNFVSLNRKVFTDKN